MVRLQGENDSSPVGMESGGTKRSRPLSSLDYKADPSKLNLVVDNTDNTATSRQQQQQQQKTNEAPLGKRQQMYTTRARGSSGIPPRARTLKDLEGMTQEQIMELLQNDPVLAAEVKEAATAYENRAKSKGDDYKGSTSQSRRSVKPKGRSDVLKEQGVPYQQWGILLFLLGIGLYQLYKVLKPPAASISKGGASVNGKKAAKQRKGSNKVLKSPADDEVVAELEGSVAKAAPTVTPKKPKKKKQATTTTSKASTKTVLEKEANAALPTRGKKQQEFVYFDEEIMDQGEWMTVGNGTARTANSKQPEVVVKPVTDDADTVHTSNTSKKKKKNGSAVPPAVAPPPTITEETTPTVQERKQNPASTFVEKPSAVEKNSPPPTIVEETTPIAQEQNQEPASTSGEKPSVKKAYLNGSAAPAPEQQEDDDVAAVPMKGKTPQQEQAPGKKKKIKKKKSKNDAPAATPGNGSLSHTDADAALAQRLQDEEDVLAAAQQQLVEDVDVVQDSANETVAALKHEDVWAEVTTKKKKQPKTTPTIAMEDAATTED